MFYKTYYFLTFYVLIICIAYFHYDYKKTPLFHINTIKYLYNGEDLNNIQ